MRVANMKHGGKQSSAGRRAISSVQGLLHSDWVLVISAFIILPNIAYLLPLHNQTFPRAIFNADFLLLGAAAFYLPRPVTVFFYIALWLIDILLVIARMYFFHLDEFVASFRFLPTGIHIQWDELPIDYLALSMLALVLGVLCAARIPRVGRKKFLIALIAGTAVLSVCDIINGSTSLPFVEGLTQDGVVLAPVNLVTSGVIKAVQDTAYDMIRRNGNWRPMSSATGLALGLAVPRSPTLPPVSTNVALILVESWGHGAHPQFDRWVARAVLTPEIRAGYDISVGTVPFSGGTSHGELRELCGVDGDYRFLSEVRARSCLPVLFAANGFQVIGVHGFSKKMYSRSRWWPQVGIRNALFKEELPGLRQCGTAFPGVCDHDTLRILADHLAQPGPQFGYLVTLNSHLPLGVVSLRDRERECVKAPIPLDEGECALVVAWRKVFASAAVMAERLKDRPTSIIIVGDHTPPLWAGPGASFFSHGVVPYIILKPRPPGRAAH